MTLGGTPRQWWTASAVFWAISIVGFVWMAAQSERAQAGDLRSELGQVAAIEDERCQQGDGQACVYIGDLFAGGDLKGQSLARARAAYARACRLGPRPASSAVPDAPNEPELRRAAIPLLMTHTGLYRACKSACIAGNQSACEQRDRYMQLLLDDVHAPDSP